MSVPPLTEEDIEMCREAFTKFDLDGSGAISAYELRETLASMGQRLSQEEIFDMVARVDADGSGEIEFSEFLKVIMLQREKTANRDDESDAIDAFVALGGNEDKTGEISVEKLKMVINEFGLTIDIQRFVEETDTDGSGLIDFTEFKTMLAESEADTNDLP